MFARAVAIAILLLPLIVIKSIVLAADEVNTTSTVLNMLPPSAPALTPTPPPAGVPLAAAPSNDDDSATGGGNNSTSNTLELTLIHNNDMHARFDQTDNVGNICTPSDAEAKKCYGGFARIGHIVREEREKGKKNDKAVLFLNAGDTFTGTPWFYLFSTNITTEFMNMLMPDAASLGNHEFDQNISLLETFLNNAEFPVLAANVDFTKTPKLAEAKSLQKYKIFDFHGTKVGVIGYITPETKWLAPKNDVEFADEIVTINAISEELKKSGVKIIIALGHSGIGEDKKIALHCQDVDVVVGGHSHTFLYTGTEPDSDKSQGPYPVVVKQESGKEVIVLQCGALTKYLCMLNLTFDADGNLSKWIGKPILLNSDVPQDPEFQSALDKYRPEINEYEATVIGKTDVLLDGLCRKVECNFGNLITDAMISQYAEYYRMVNGDTNCSDVSIAFTQGGSIRSSIKPGNITKLNLNSALPFQNPIVVLKVTGADIKKMLEHSVERYSNETAWGEFLQMSGVKVHYDLTKEIGQRVIYVEVRDLNCNATNYFKLDESEHYKILVPRFLMYGGDGFDMLHDKEFEDFPLNDYEIVEKYIMGKKKPIYPMIQDRIVFKNSGTKVNPMNHGGKSKSGANNLFIKNINIVLLIPLIVINKIHF